MRRWAFVGTVFVGTTAAALGAPHRAEACGGCFHPPPPPTQVATDITDERMLLSVSQTQTTLYDQIRYAGTPSSFAWVLPIHGTVTVGLSADVLFDSIDALTTTQIQPPPSSCPSPPSCGGGGCLAASSSDNAAAPGPAFGGGGEAPPPVVVTKQANVGPYATVQLHATDSGALDDWLTTNGFEIPAAVTPIIDAYLREGFDFLAMKLLPSQGVQAMRPVRVSTKGAAFSLPLRMAAIGTGATVGITIWVVSDGRYEPQNYPFFHIDDSALIWDWQTSSSNYTALRAQNENASSNKSWEIESSIDLNQQVITSAILSGGHGFSPYGGFNGSAPPSDPSEDYLPVGMPAAPPAQDAGPESLLPVDVDAGAEAGAEGGADPATDDAGSEDDGAAVPGAPEAGAPSGAELPQTAEEVRAADIATLFAGLAGPNVRVTRIRSDIAHAAMTADLVLQASADQSAVSNIRTVKQSVNEQCPIYNGCSVVGQGSPAQSAASQHHGCSTSIQRFADRSAAPGALAGIGGIFLARFLRRRRRS